MAASSTEKLLIAKELTLKAMESIRHNFGSDISATEYNELYAKEIDKIFRSIYTTVNDAELAVRSGRSSQL
ncbi:hypothetical protein WMW72_35205 [Paenibacillus filicis]|uniref:Uncharacterized protein n=1 Tax=Paenibacillus filicis TaxID=669464 RepID=A0ABU9DYC1_9BACL